MDPFLLGGSSETTGSGYFGKTPVAILPGFVACVPCSSTQVTMNSKNQTSATKKTTSRNQQTPNNTIHTSLPSMQACKKKEPLAHEGTSSRGPRDTAVGPPVKTRPDPPSRVAPPPGTAYLGGPTRRRAPAAKCRISTWPRGSSSASRRWRRLVSRSPREERRHPGWVGVALGRLVGCLPSKNRGHWLNSCDKRSATLRIDACGL